MVAWASLHECSLTGTLPKKHELFFMKNNDKPINYAAASEAPNAIIRAPNIKGKG